MDEAELRIARSLCDDGRLEVNRADTKSSILLAAFGLLLAPLIAVGLDDLNGWDGLGMPIRVTIAVSATFTVAGFLALLASIFPRTVARGRKKSRTGVLPIGYFGDVGGSDAAEIVLRISRTARVELSIHAKQLHAISEILRTKYMYLRLAIGLLGCGTTGLYCCALIGAL